MSNAREGWRVKLQFAEGAYSILVPLHAGESVEEVITYLRLHYPTTRGVPVVGVGLEVVPAGRS